MMQAHCNRKTPWGEGGRGQRLNSIYFQFWRLEGEVSWGRSGGASLLFLTVFSRWRRPGCSPRSLL